MMMLNMAYLLRGGWSGRCASCFWLTSFDVTMRIMSFDWSSPLKSSSNSKLVSLRMIPTLVNHFKIYFRLNFSRFEIFLILSISDGSNLIFISLAKVVRQRIGFLARSGLMSQIAVQVLAQPSFA